MKNQATIEAYWELKVKGKGETQKEFVFQTIRFHKDITRQEIANVTGFGINAVCGRVSELMKAGRVSEESSIRKCRVTGRSVHSLLVG